MVLDYPNIIVSSAKSIRMTHDVRYRTSFEGLQNSTSAVKITAMQFDDKNPSRDLIEQTLREQLGIAENIAIEIVSVGPFTGYMTKA